MVMCQAGWNLRSPSLSFPPGGWSTRPLGDPVLPRETRRGEPLQAEEKEQAVSLGGRSPNSLQL